MKKKVFKIILFTAIIIVAGYNYKQNKKTVEFSDLVLDNVEALASGEDGNETYKYVIPGTHVACVCSGTGDLSCC
ncbi:MAG: NVEALA domain-containing protein [Parabacteroides sp.]|nr:NVEALA domain-containing protein [Parabacteroides sp.]